MSRGRRIVSRGFLRAAVALLLALGSACRPSAAGRCSTNADCRTGAICSSVGVCVADLLTVSVVAPADAVSGWVRRSGPDLEVDVQVPPDRMFPVQVDLTLTPCPAGTPLCSWSATASAPGTVRLLVPRAVQTAGSEAPVPFTVAARDTAGVVSTRPGSFLIDDKPPTVGLGRVLYGSSSPPYPSVCASDEIAACTTSSPCPARGFHCGRGSAQAPDHVLRDDLVTVQFDVTDCGAGVLGTGATWTAESAGIPTLPSAATELTTLPSTCPAGAADPTVHRFALRLPVAAVAQLDPPDATGTTRIRLAQQVSDRLQLRGSSSALSPASPPGDGIVLVSLVRWRSQLGGRAVGAPALVGGTTPKRIAIPTDASALLSVPVNIDVFGIVVGNLVTGINVPGGINGDLAANPTGTMLFAINGSTPTSNAAFIDPNGSFRSVICPMAPSGVVLGPTLSLGPLVNSIESVVAYAATTPAVAPPPPVLFGYGLSGGGSGSCSLLSTATSAVLTPNASGLTGTTQAPVGGTPSVFVSHSQGFSAVSFSPPPPPSTSTPVFGTTGTNYATTPLPALPAPPSLLPPSLSGSGPFAFFGLGTAGANPRRGDYSAGPPVSWNEGARAPVSVPVSHTPVYDGAAVYVTDDSNVVSAFALLPGSTSPGALLNSVPPASPTLKVSPPLLLRGPPSVPNQLLVIQSDGLVRLMSLLANPPLELDLVVVNGTKPGVRPFAPVAQTLRVGSSIVFVVDGGGCDATGTCNPSWLWAVQLDAEALAASSSAWVRPGRDSCNSRSSVLASPCL